MSPDAQAHGLKVAELINQIYDRAYVKLFEELGRAPFRDEVGVRVANTLVLTLVMNIWRDPDDQIEYFEECIRTLMEGRQVVQS